MDEVAHYRLSPAAPDHAGSDVMEEAAPAGPKPGGWATQVRPADREDPIFGRSAALRRLARDLDSLSKDPAWTASAPAAAADATADVTARHAALAPRAGFPVEHETMSLADLDQAIDGLSRRLSGSTEATPQRRVTIDGGRLAQLKALARSLADELDQLPELPPEEPAVPPMPAANSLPVPFADPPQAPVLNDLPEFPPLPDFPPLPETTADVEAAAAPARETPEPPPEPPQLAFPVAAPPMAETPVPGTPVAVAPVAVAPVTVAPVTVAPVAVAPVAAVPAALLEPVARDAVPPHPSAEDRPDWSAIQMTDLPRKEHRGSTVIVGTLAAAAVLLSGALAVDHLWLSGPRGPAHPPIALAPARAPARAPAHALAADAAAGHPGAAPVRARPEVKQAPHLAAAMAPVAQPLAHPTAHPLGHPTALRIAAASPPADKEDAAVAPARADTPAPRAAAAKAAPAAQPAPAQPAPAQPAPAQPAPARLAATRPAAEPPAAATATEPPLPPVPAAAQDRPAAPAIAADAAKPPAKPSVTSATAPAAPTSAPAAASKPAGTAATGSTEAAATALPVAAPAPAAPPAPMVVRFTGDAWIQVLSPAGKVVFSRLMHAGESWTPPAHGLLLTTGNAGATELVVNGVMSPPLGAVGAVRHMIPLDPARPAG